MKIFGTNKKIKVQFIDNLTGQTIAVSELETNQLPQTFSVQTTMHIQDNDWNVEEAIPENSVDFIESKSLVLKMRRIEKINVNAINDIWYIISTVSNEFPQTVAITQQSEFDIHIHGDDYRQREFLNIDALPRIEEEFIGIKNIWENYSQKEGEYTVFKHCHVRSVIGTPNLVINFNELKSVLKSNLVGQVVINGEKLKDGFAIKTDNATYFGTLINETVTELCILEWNESMTTEIKEIDKVFNLLFVDWNQYKIVKND